MRALFLFAERNEIKNKIWYNKRTDEKRKENSAKKAFSEIKKRLTNMDKEVYTVKDVQRILGCGKTYVYRLFSSDIFPSFRIGGRLYVRRKLFEAFLESCEERNVKL